MLDAAFSQPTYLIMKGRLKIEETEKEQKEALKQKTKEEAIKLKKIEYLKSLRNKIHE